jgi:hypothetical protein
MKKRSQAQRNRKTKRAKEIKEEHLQVSGPIVYFVSKYDCFPISRNHVIQDEIPLGWTITKHGFVDPIELDSFNPNDYEGLNVSRKQFLANPQMYEGLTPKKKMETFHQKRLLSPNKTFSVTFQYNPVDSTFVSCPRPYTYNVFGINWSQTMMDMMKCISSASFIGCSDILFLISLYASPISVFIREAPTKIQNSYWFLGENDCEDRVRDLLHNNDTCREYFEFLGINNIAHILSQDSNDEKLFFLQSSKEEQFQLFVNMLDTKTWVSSWLEEHFFLPH